MSNPKCRIRIIDTLPSLRTKRRDTPLPWHIFLHTSMLLLLLLALAVCFHKKYMRRWAGMRDAPLTSQKGMLFPMSLSLIVRIFNKKSLTRAEECLS